MQNPRFYVPYLLPALISADNVSVDNVSAADASRLHGVFRNVSPKSTSNSAVNAHPGCFKITVQGNGSILATDTFSAADALRTAGTYTNVSQSATTGVGTGAVFNVTVDSSGAVSNLKIIETRNKGILLHNF